jgi:hypothetical protein
MIKNQVGQSSLSLARIQTEDKPVPTYYKKCQNPDDPKNFPISLSFQRMEKDRQMMTAELLDLLVRMTPPSHRLELVVDNNNGLETAKAVITANSHVKRSLADLRADLAVLEFESKLLSRLLYKLHNRFRNDRGYKALRILEKSGKCVCKETV